MPQPSAIESLGLTFFGTVSATISHEIKNSLAIINENAGLLQDLTVLAEKGDPLSLKRLQRLSVSIRRQVDRTDAIVKKMNRFSHSADPVRQPVNLYETTLFMTEVCDRLIRLRSISIRIIPPNPPVVIATRVFYLERLIWMCINEMMHAMAEGDILTLAIENRSGEACIRLSAAGPLPALTAAAFSSQAEKAMQDILQARILIDPQNGETLLKLSKEIH
jgi:signal transduction histidine kinase